MCLMYNANKFLNGLLSSQRVTKVVKVRTRCITQVRSKRFMNYYSIVKAVISLKNIKWYFIIGQTFQQFVWLSFRRENDQLAISVAQNSQGVMSLGFHISFRIYVNMASLSLFRPSGKYMSLVPRIHPPYPRDSWLSAHPHELRNYHDSYNYYQQSPH